ncbi:hypothetical protein JG688_00015377 [Phytophthora aleatoria]|uniref:Uncharacterized protein n=1 Tax=Phytophthora aleatoria TaxID=2496075 RepID=A0A8J5MDF9_9STRA|nr:hypothetical protein JG688_00015377 [Phytophthora aleatoria]
MNLDWLKVDEDWGTGNNDLEAIAAAQDRCFGQRRDDFALSPLNTIWSLLLQPQLPNQVRTNELLLSAVVIVIYCDCEHCEKHRGTSMNGAIAILKWLMIAPNPTRAQRLRCACMACTNVTTAPTCPWRVWVLACQVHSLGTIEGSSMPH